MEAQEAVLPNIRAPYVRAALLLVSANAWEHFLIQRIMSVYQIIREPLHSMVQRQSAQL